MEIRINEFLKKDLKDEVVIFQTDTVYGLGCLISSEKGVERIYEIKKRDGNKPLAVLCANIEQVKSIVSDFELGRKIGEKYWPGALTLIMPKKNIIGNFITSNFDTVAVRIPNDKIALSILEKNGPMAVTSLNLSTEPAILNYADAYEYVNEVDYLVEGVDLNSISSTIYDCINQRTLRNGEIKID